MKYYLAPMEGITGYIYRNAYHELFHPMDKYFTPFLVPNKSKGLKSKELNDILPEHNSGLVVIPQILTNCAEDFIQMVGKLKLLGYGEVNLNLGCPSGTVVAKNKGSGFLAKQEELNRFFDTVFSQIDIRMSVKTRIGKNSPDEFYKLIEIYNQYPMEELIIHPRIQTDFYNNEPNYEVFKDALNLSKNSICYNGDIFTEGDYQSLCSVFPDVKRVMLGRGVIVNPGLMQLISGQPQYEKQTFKDFHDQILSDYQEILSGERNVLFRMKELWFYMGNLFSNSQKYIKRIKKAEKLYVYEAAVSDLFQEQNVIG